MLTTPLGELVVSILPCELGGTVTLGSDTSSTNVVITSCLAMKLGALEEKSLYPNASAHAYTHVLGKCLHVCPYTRRCTCPTRIAPKLEGICS